jgi:hypothetical protein
VEDSQDKIKQKKHLAGIDEKGAAKKKGRISNGST